jgi:flagellar biogenesis protein FliO
MSLKKTQIVPATQVIQREGSILQAILRQFWKNLVGLVSSTRIQRRIKRMEVVERVAVGAKQSVMLLRLDQQEFVVGCSGENLVLLGTRDLGASAQAEPAILQHPPRAPRKKRTRKLANAPTAAELLREFQGSIQ